MKTKHPGGRPKKTLKDLPLDWKDKILSMSAEGLSDVQIRARLCLAGGKFNQKTWDALESREDEFSLTLKSGKVLCESWWQDQAKSGLRTKNFQTGLWTMNMKNRFGWRDKEATVIDNSTHHHYALQTIRQRRNDQKTKVVTENRVNGFQENGHGNGARPRVTPLSV